MTFFFTSVAIKIKENDSIANVIFLDYEDVIVLTKKGYGIQFKTGDIAAVGRVASGVKAIKLSEDDDVIIGLAREADKNLAVITEKGMGKIIDLSEFPCQGRGGKGIIYHKGGPGVGDVAGVAMINKDDSLLLIGKPSSICISATDLPTLGRTSVGNQMIKNSTITKVIKL